MGFRCSKCQTVISEITVRAWTVYSEQTVVIDPQTHIIRAISPAVCRSVIKSGMEIDRKNKSAIWICPNCNYSGPPSDYTPVLMCAVTGVSDAKYTAQVPWGDLPVCSGELASVVQDRFARLPVFRNTDNYSF